MKQKLTIINMLSNGECKIEQRETEVIPVILNDQWILNLKETMNQKVSSQPERLNEKNNLDLKNPLSGKIIPLKHEHSSKEMNDQWVLDPDCMR